MKPAWLLLVLFAPCAMAGSAEAPEVKDPEGDCALAYGAAYLDVVAVWIDAESEAAFDVAIRLAAFDAAVAEGAGYTAQFEHQGKVFGVVALHRPASGAGWEFYTGRVDASEAEQDTLTARAGSFDEATATIRVTFPKMLFPHRESDDRELRGFEAMSADLRPAYPFLLGVDRFDPDSSDGKWLVCDTARSDAAYAFRVGAHSEEHAEHATQAPEPPAAAEAPAPAPPADAPDAPAPPEGSRDVPVPAWLAVVALAFSRAARSRGR